VPLDSRVPAMQVARYSTQRTGDLTRFRFSLK